MHIKRINELRPTHNTMSVVYNLSVIEKFRGKLATAGRSRRSMEVMALSFSYLIAGGLPIYQLKW